MWFWHLDKGELGHGKSEFMVDFIRFVGNHRNAWSHHGMLHAWSISDPRGRLTWTRHPPSPKDLLAGGQWTFDPTNRVYSRVMSELCPGLSEQLGWQFAAFDETCGDCIEALLGVWAHCPWEPYHDEWRPTEDCVSLRRAAGYFERMSSWAYRIFRILDWFRGTFAQVQRSGARFYSDAETDIIHQAINWAGRYYIPPPPPR
jgi:hypothetical protein